MKNHITEKKAFDFYNQNSEYFEKCGDNIHSRPRYKKLADKVYGVVLDVAAGKGPVNVFLNQNEKVKNIIACDISSLALAANDAKQKIQSFGGALPFKNNSVDCTICINSLEHMPDPEQVVKEMVRVSKELIIITSPNFANPFLESESLRRKPLQVRLKIFTKKLFGISPIFINPEYTNFKSDADVCYELNVKDLIGWFKKYNCQLEYFTVHYRPELIYRIVLQLFSLKIFKNWGPIVFLAARKPSQQ